MDKDGNYGKIKNFGSTTDLYQIKMADRDVYFIANELSEFNRH